MNRKILILIGSIVVLAAVATTIAFAARKDNMANVHTATARFHRTEAARRASIPADKIVEVAQEIVFSGDMNPLQRDRFFSPSLAAN